MDIKISPNNSKIGNIPNFSLPPGASCVPGVPCFKGGCYAVSSYRRFTNVKKAWDANLEMYKKEPDKFFIGLEDYLDLKGPERFRVFVSGDFPDEAFWIRLVDTMEYACLTKFLIFTKRYDYDYSIKPDNCQIILSTWPGLELPTNKDLPWAWLEEDVRRPKEDTYLVCPGGCELCHHKCWDFVEVDIPVVFRRH